MEILLCRPFFLLKSATVAENYGKASDYCLVKDFVWME
ncbi:MAG: hypothetical protein RLZZ399_1210 [Verrucomicrobiota bacterium]|jgi:hypothetical protein